LLRYILQYSKRCGSKETTDIYGNGASFAARD
jgi:hypothetical protein